MRIGVSAAISLYVSGLPAISPLPVRALMTAANHGETSFKNPRQKRVIANRLCHSDIPMRIGSPHRIAIRSTATASARRCQPCSRHTRNNAPPLISRAALMPRGRIRQWGPALGQALPSARGTSLPDASGPQRRAVSSRTARATPRAAQLRGHPSTRRSRATRG